MSEENPEEYRVKGDAEFTGKKTVVKVNVDKDGIKEEIKQELKKEENADKAVQLFLKLKQDYSEKYPAYSELFSSCESPAELFDALQAAQNEKPQEQKRAPMGKAPMYSSNDSEFGSHAEVIDKLYFDGYYNPEATPEQKKEARAKIDKLFTSLKDSGAWRTLKESGVSGFGKPIPPHMTCAKCQGTIQNYPCKLCGYDPKTHEPYLFKPPQREGSGMAGVPK
jgi:hypothetical protein